MAGSVDLNDPNNWDLGSYGPCLEHKTYHVFKIACYFRMNRFLRENSNNRLLYKAAVDTAIRER